MRIGVLMGGDSPEREISLVSGRAALDALVRKGYNAVGIDVGADIAEKLCNAGVGTAAGSRLDSGMASMEIAFIALHGAGGEDGRIQGLLEQVGVRYTGSGIEPSVLCMNKWLSKVMMNHASLPTAEFCSITSVDAAGLVDLDEWLPLVVKPAVGGSTLGISIVKEPAMFAGAVKAAFRYDKRVIIERFVAGREFSVGILAGEVLPVIEVVPKSGFYDYEAKYTHGSTVYTVPAEIDREQAEKLQKTALDAHLLFGCRGVSRVDFRLNESGEPFILEINTIPGMAPTSLLPKMAASAGIDYDSMIEKILLAAVSDA